MDDLKDPNLNADMNKNMAAADRLSISDKNLQFILIYNDTSAILGGTNMTSRHWSGSIWYYNQISEFDRDKALVTTNTESGVCDGVYLEHNKFLVADDNGCLQVFNFVEAGDKHVPMLQCSGFTSSHNSALVTLSVFNDNEHLVTGDSDYCIKVWDITELITTYSFPYAHENAVTCVDVQPRSNTTFVSTSLDCEALMWDLRQSKPAQSILKKDIGLTTVNWNSVLDHIVAIGSDNGDVVLMDIRKPGVSVLEETCIFPRPVQKLLFNPNPERSEDLACCCDDNFVHVLDVNNNFSSLYKNEDHTDFVRGLSWYKDQLFSCSWDSTVLRHDVYSHHIK
ncbi:methylosome protein 50-like [Colletes gigas]|uniref:methylosome protein 50-like n=1 Tax=Colletes gigas TaxID=935657 RepID=UPI001C9BBCE2|nr:methylosome protein 50-like [Colletes gigas]